MPFTAAHLELHTRDLAAARRFYVDQLGLQVVQDTPPMRLIAVHAGTVRLSIFERADARPAGSLELILATANLDAAIAALAVAGVALDGPPRTAGSFLRFVTVRDPDGNRISLAEYFRDPLESV